MIKIEFKTFLLIKNENGILLISKLNTSYQFYVIANHNFGFVVSHGGETEYLRYEINFEDLDLTNMVTYHASDRTNPSSFWSVAIPFGKNENYFIDNDKLHFELSRFHDFDEISIHKEFSANEFPFQLERYGSLSIVTGFPE